MPYKQSNRGKRIQMAALICARTHARTHTQRRGAQMGMQVEKEQIRCQGHKNQLYKHQKYTKK